MAPTDTADSVGLRGDAPGGVHGGDPEAKPGVDMEPIEGRVDWQVEIMQQLQLAAPICGMNLLNYLVNLSAGDVSNCCLTAT